MTHCACCCCRCCRCCCDCCCRRCCFCCCGGCCRLIPPRSSAAPTMVGRRQEVQPPRALRRGVQNARGFQAQHEQRRVRDPAHQGEVVVWPLVAVVVVVVVVAVVVLVVVVVVVGSGLYSRSKATPSRWSSSADSVATADPAQNFTKSNTRRS